MALDAVSGSIRAAVNLDVSKALTGLNNTTHNVNIAKAITFTLGVGAAAFNQLYAATVSLAGAATTTLDLNGGLADPVGNTAMTIVRVKFVFAQLLSTTDDATVGTACSSVTLGNAATNQFVGWFGGGTETITLTNGAFFMVGRPDATGWLTTAATLDNFKILNNDAVVAAAVRIVIGGGAT